MKIIGVTGGIGSGKSTVVKMFKDLGIPIYVADNRAKELMQHSKKLKADIVQLLGENSYVNGKLNRKFIAAEVFNKPDKLNALNNIVHPAVSDDFDEWIKGQNKINVPYCIYEAAILFESKRQNICDFIILITAPRSVRINRVIERDDVLKSEVVNRMKHQWSEEEKRELADVIVENTDLNDTRKQVQKLHKFILKNLT